ncbi:ATPase [Marasmius tenuissimus]|uniref:ATPase n=1 Tax=Marasmius tenuissimus TaxID=585030 RepID=A0ABR3A3W1_9AGAR
MTRTLTKVSYKPDSQSTEEYMIIVNPEEYNKWKDGAFQIFHTTQGTQGILGHASKQQLENTFGTSKDIDVVQQILEKGKSQTGTINTSNFGTTNAAKGSAVIDSRGKGLSGI